MKKLALVLMSVMVGMFWVSESAMAYTIYDPVRDTIGGEVFEIYGMDVTQVGSDISFSIYTNYPEAGYPVGSWNTLPGDFAIDVDCNGTYEYGFALTNHDGFSAGSLYNVTNWYKSDNYEPSPPPGSYWDYNHGQIVRIKSGSLSYPGSYSWNSIGGDPDYQIDIGLSNDFLPMFFDDNIGLYWAAGTCANDVIGGTGHVVGPIPEPTTMLLFGSGLLGLAGLARARRKKA